MSLSASYHPGGTYVRQIGVFLVSMLCLTISLDSSGICLLPGTSYGMPTGSSFARSIAFSPDGSYIVTSNAGSNDVAVFKIEADGVISDAKKYPISAGSHGPHSATYSPNGLYVATANSELLQTSDVTVLHVISGGALTAPSAYFRPSGSGSTSSLAYSPDSNLLATANSLDSVTLFQVDQYGALGGGVNYPLPTDAGPNAITFSPDGSLLATLNSGLGWEDGVTIFKVDAGALHNATSYNLPFPAVQKIALAFSPNGKHLAIANYGSDNIALLQVNTEGELSDGISYTLPISSFPRSFAFSPDGLHLAVFNLSAANITIFQVDANGVLSAPVSFSVPGSLVQRALAFSPNGAYLVSADYDTYSITVFPVIYGDCPSSSSSGTETATSLSSDGDGSGQTSQAVCLKSIMSSLCL